MHIVKDGHRQGIQEQFRGTPEADPVLAQVTLRFDGLPFDGVAQSLPAAGRRQGAIISPLRTDHPHGFLEAAFPPRPVFAILRDFVSLAGSQEEIRFEAVLFGVEVVITPLGLVE